MSNNNLQDKIVINDPWVSLRSYTDARIALGRTGVSIPLKENLQFRLAHAYARDAVYARLSMDNLLDGLQSFQLPILQLQSQCANRSEYLQRPDWGRKLNEESKSIMQSISGDACDIAIVVADGLSAVAINQHLLPLLQLLIPLLNKNNYSIAPISIVQQARVAIADEVGNLLKARLSIIFIGERPGLTSPNSMGAYITFNPQIGLTDERRNCISNIRPEGLQYEFAVEKITYLIRQAVNLQISGVTLKDNKNGIDNG
jgi:ethanolamine ammonia-lyase small subunit